MLDHLEHLDAANTQLHVKARILLADGAAIAADAQVGPVNLFLHSLFSDVDVSLNEMGRFMGRLRNSLN